MPKPDFVRAHKHSIRNETEIRASETCGCFCCLTIFPPSDIVDWVDEPTSDERTPLCPYCHIDSVIGSQSGYPITPEFLDRMEKHWFGIRS